MTKYEIAEHIRALLDMDFSDFIEAALELADEIAAEAEMEEELEDQQMYWINAKTNPPKENEKIIALDRYGRLHPMILKDGWYNFHGTLPDGGEQSYAANELAFPLWYIPRPEMED